MKKFITIISLAVSAVLVCVAIFCALHKRKGEKI